MVLDECLNFNKSRKLLDIQNNAPCNLEAEWISEMVLSGHAPRRHHSLQSPTPPIRITPLGRRTPPTRKKKRRGSATVRYRPQDKEK